MQSNSALTESPGNLSEIDNGSPNHHHHHHHNHQILHQRGSNQAQISVNQGQINQAPPLYNMTTYNNNSSSINYPPANHPANRGLIHPWMINPNPNPNANTTNSSSTSDHVHTRSALGPGHLPTFAVWNDHHHHHT